MLKKLRVKIVVIAMSLVSLALLFILGLTYYSTFTGSIANIESSLGRSLEMDDSTTPMIGSKGKMEDGGNDAAGLFSIRITVSDEGTVLNSGEGAIVSTEALGMVVKQVQSGTKHGYDSSRSIAWKSTETDEGITRISIVDTTATFDMLRHLAAQDVAIFFAAFAVLLIPCWKLADVVTRPVEEAWVRQRQFVADASHELKTPLAVIMANLEILEHDEGLPQDSLHWVETTSDEAKHMKALVTDLLELARADEASAGSSGIIPEDNVNLSDLVEEAALEFDAIAFESGCTIDERIAENICVIGDKEWLARLVKILIENACKYAQKGTTIDVRLERADKHARYAVTNQGTKIDDEDLAHLFDRFYRSDKARSREDAGGFGLGLAIAKGIAESHGGTIAATSTKAEGTTFEVKIPVAKS